MSDAPRKDRHTIDRDTIEVGAMFGLLAGVAAFVVDAAIAAPATLLATTAPPLLDLLGWHAVNVLGYVLAGTLAGLCWPWRRRRLGRFLVHWWAWTAIALSAFTWAEGPLWSWSVPVWGKVALAAALMAVAFGTEVGTRSTPAAPK